MSAEREAAEVLSAAIEAVLRGAGLTDKPGDYDDGIHSWRCSYPDRYGPCNCFAELVTDLAAALAAAAGGREAEAARHAAYEKGFTDGVQSTANAIHHHLLTKGHKDAADDLRFTGTGTSAPHQPTGGSDD